MQVSGAAAKHGQGRGAEAQDVSAGTQGCPRLWFHVPQTAGGVGYPSPPSLPCLAQPGTIHLP